MGVVTNEIRRKILMGEVGPYGQNLGTVSENVEGRCHTCMAKGAEIILENMSLMEEGFGGEVIVTS